MNGIDLSWAGIKSLIRVERTGTRGDKPYHEVVCYISSLIHPAREFACGIRGHWSIENRLHWIKDVVMKEDDSKIRMGNAEREPLNPQSVGVARRRHRTQHTAPK